MKIISILFFSSMLLFACNSKPRKAAETTQNSASVEMILEVTGMTCDHCEMTVEKTVLALEGISDIKADHTDSSAVIKFDTAQVNLKEISAALARKGYQVKGQRE